MTLTTSHGQRRAFVAATAAALLAACADGARLAPERSPATTAPHPNLARGPVLGACAGLGAPAGSTLALHAYARGVQIYHWTGTGWSFDRPSAVLSADARGASTIGTHYRGPTWESVSGGTVVGALLAPPCPVDADAIPWLALRGTPDGGPGVFRAVTFIQRVNTVGGKAPAGPGSYVGEVREVPYTAEYYFWRAP